MTNLFVAKIHNIPSKTKRQDLFRFFKPIKPYSIRIPPKQKGFAYVGYKTEAELKKALLKDKSFLGGKQVKVVDFTAKDRLRSEEEKNRGANKKDNPKWLRQKESVCSESIVESGKLFYRNLAYSVKEEDLKQLFEKYGPVAEIDLPIDANTRKLKGFGTVTFLMPEHAVLAYNELNGSFFHGRMFHILPAKVDEKEKEDQDETGLSFKEKKEKKLKQTAQSSHNWNTLFMGENAIAEVIAKKYGKSKEDVLNTEGGTTSAAVRLALGETEIVMEMQQFLEDSGLHLDAFNGVAKNRSNTIILAKNLPAGTEAKELTERFGKFGLLGRVVLPPSGITAVIEFLDPSEAKKAFKKLAYTRFKSLPLYLEWAPENTFSKPATKAKPDKNETPESKPPVEDKKPKSKKEPKTEAEPAPVVAQQSEKLSPPVEDDTPPEEGTTLFLKNLSFQTNEDFIRDFFKSIGPIHSVQVVRKKEGDRSESRGYGFIQFKHRKSADTALKNLQSVLIDGRKVELSRSDRTLSTDVDGKARKGTKMKKQTGSKILVRNVPFQANVKEIRDLFKAFGELKSVRLPRKMVSGADESHRGFCFVDFVSENDAKRAFEALCLSTHLYGRRLVLEWAEAEDGVEELRKRTAEKFAGSSGASDAKRSRKGVFDSSQIGSMAEEGARGDDDDGDDDEEGGF